MAEGSPICDIIAKNNSMDVFVVTAHHTLVSFLASGIEYSYIYFFSFFRNRLILIVHNVHTDSIP